MPSAGSEGWEGFNRSLFLSRTALHKQAPTRERWVVRLEARYRSADTSPEAGFNSPAMLMQWTCHPKGDACSNGNPLPRCSAACEFNGPEAFSSSFRPTMREWGNRNGSEVLRFGSCFEGFSALNYTGFKRSPSFYSIWQPVFESSLCRPCRISSANLQCSPWILTSLTTRGK